MSDKVVKRNKSLEDFDFKKIVNAITNAGKASCEFDLTEANILAALTCNALTQNKTLNQAQMNIESIQDTIEYVLMRKGYYKSARAFIVYREQHAMLRLNKKISIDAIGSIDEYLNKTDWRVKANANQDYSLGGLVLTSSGKMTANYWLSHVYAPKLGKAHREGDLHVHDLDLLTGYCAGWSLRMLLQEGLNGIPNKVSASPPKHMSSAVGQIVNFLGTMQNEWAGAQAFSSFDTYMAPYIRIDKMTYEQVKQNIQELIYNLNVPSRWGSQPPFTNLTFDWTCPEDLKPQIPVIGGKNMSFCYGDLQTEMDMINRAYIEVMTEGDVAGRIFTFPIPTYNITPEFDWDGPNTEALFEMTAKYGLPYFQNFLNSDLSPKMVRSMCCRLQLDLTELLKRGNGLFGSVEQTGSIGVVTINCARLGYTNHNITDLYTQLDYLLDLARDSLETKRKVIQRYMDQGLYPYSKRYLGTLRNHFSTIGVNGINEMIRNFTQDQEDITTDKGQELALNLLDYIRDKMIKFQSETGHMYNLEATPAEGATYRFAKEDQKRFPDIIQAGCIDAPYYTNSSQVPVKYTDDPFHALELQEKLQGKYTGGTVFHVYIGQRVPDATTAKHMVRKFLSNYKIPYLTLSPTFSICPVHGYLAGDFEFCPTCDIELNQMVVATKR